jgi:hypothetical protein
VQETIGRGESSVTNPEPAGVAQVAVALEVGPKRKVFAQARDWIGWCRAGRDEAAALAQLVATGPRYARVATRAGQPFVTPTAVEQLVVIERAPGTAVTDFGAPSALLASDTEPLAGTETERLTRLLVACWATFDEAVRGVPADLQDVKPEHGRSPSAMRLHLLETDRMHLRAFGRAFHKADPAQLTEQEAALRVQMLASFRAVPRDEAFVPYRGYGFSWTPRFAVRRSAWHALDHAWELQDRLSAPPS